MPSIQDLIAATPSISARPDSIASLLEIIDDPVVEADKLLPIVERDPGLTAGLLKLCNSPIYGLRRIIGAPREALVLVGNLTFARLCFTLSLEPVLHRDLPGYQLDLDDLWQHCLATAYGAAFLIQGMGLRDQRERAFTAGLLHDIGKLVLDRQLDATPAAPPPPGAAMVDANGDLTCDQERQRTGFDHAQAGAALLRSWDVPEAITAAIECHHDPSRAGEHARLAAAVNVANRISHVAVQLQAGSRSVEQFVARTFSSCPFAQQSVQDLAATIAAKHENILSLALSPRG